MENEDIAVAVKVSEVIWDKDLVETLKIAQAVQVVFFFLLLLETVL